MDTRPQAGTGWDKQPTNIPGCDKEWFQIWEHEISYTPAKNSARIPGHITQTGLLRGAFLWTQDAQGTIQHAAVANTQCHYKAVNLCATGITRAHKIDRREMLANSSHPPPGQGQIKIFRGICPEMIMVFPCVNPVRSHTKITCLPVNPPSHFSMDNPLDAFPMVSNSLSSKIGHPKNSAWSPNWALSRDWNKQGETKQTLKACVQQVSKGVRQVWASYKHWTFIKPYRGEGRDLELHGTFNKTWDSPEFFRGNVFLPHKLQE